MPELVRLYIRNVAFGAALSAVFVAILVGGNVANLRHLIFASDVGYIALALLFVFNTVVFAGVQFGITIMRMADDDGASGGGRRDAIPAMKLQPIRVVEQQPARTMQRRNSR